MSLGSYCSSLGARNRNRWTRGDRRTPVVPDSYFANFCSQEMNTALAVPVCARFSCDASNESLLVMGNEAGVLFIGNVDRPDEHGNIFTRGMFADAGCLLDMDFMRREPAHLVTISGHSHVTMWDVEKGLELRQFIGHEGSVRALAVSNDAPDVFATGARDGTICLWDQREQPIRRLQVEPLSVISSAHYRRSAPTSASKRNTPSRTMPIEPKGITSLTFLDSNTLISASTSCQTGILFRDLRYWGNSVPVRRLVCPEASSKRDFGVTSICLNRHRSSLFAGTTGSYVWEYAINSTKNTPVDVLRGVKRSLTAVFDMKLSASPISDHLTYGSGDHHALIWDLQEKNVSNTMSAKHYPYPKFILGGHASEVSMAQFSCSGRFMVTLDDACWRLWNFDAASMEKEPGSTPAGFERAAYYKLKESQCTASQLEKLSVEPGTSSGKKRKTGSSPFRSPFKSPPVVIRGDKSPANKITKFSSSPLSPLPNLYNVDSTSKPSRSGRSARRLDFSPEQLSPVENESAAVEPPVEKPKCAFHYKYPTENLPDWVRDRYRLMTERYKEHPSPPSTSQRTFTSIAEYFNTPSPGISNCSQLVSLAERELLRSPRKLLLKERLKESGEKAKRVKQATPRRARPTPRRAASANTKLPKTPTSSCIKPATPRAPKTAIDTLPRLGKTIKDFFSKKT